MKPLWILKDLKKNSIILNTLSDKKKYCSYEAFIYGKARLGDTSRYTPVKVKIVEVKKRGLR